jgi:hypothetical protein
MCPDATAIQRSGMKVDMNGRNLNSDWRAMTEDKLNGVNSPRKPPNEFHEAEILPQIPPSTATGSRGKKHLRYIQLTGECRLIRDDRNRGKGYWR